MSTPPETKGASNESRADWNEEFDAWLELIEYRLGTISLWLKVLVVVLVVFIAVLLLTWLFPDLSYTSPFLRHFLSPWRWLGFD